MTNHRPLALVILDGWGCRESREANAVALADTPVFDGLSNEYRCSRLRTSGNAVGLPEGQMGNSEVGHLTLGAGAIQDQDLLRIDKAIESGRISGEPEELPVLQAAFERARRPGAALHLMGLVGDGGVHAHARHLEALILAARDAGVERIYVHAFLDGRDTPPRSGLGFVQDLEGFMAREGAGRIVSLAGRYYAMDRDHRWERTAAAWRAIAADPGVGAWPSAAEAIRAAYADHVTDEFVPPLRIARPELGEAGRARSMDAADAPAETVGNHVPDDRDTGLRAGDAVLLFNFRADRMRQLLQVLGEAGVSFEGFPRDLPADLYVATLTRYLDGQTAPAVFAPRDVERPLARVISEAGLRQLHTAETEKYAHVTYFFNGGRERPYPGETHVMTPSPKVATYDLQPEMSAVPLTDALVGAIEARSADFYLINYANPDMVGHTGDLDAAIQAVETVDACLGRVIEALRSQEGTTVVTADHGNCEMMVDPDTGGPHTAHTLNPVPFIVVAPAFRRETSAEDALASGGLSDVAPTILKLMGLEAPESMTGRPLC